MSVQEFAETCPGKFTYGKGVLAMGKDKNDISGIAKELLERIEKKCPDENKYEIALQVLKNQNKMIYSDPADKERIKLIGDKILEIHSILNPPRKSEEALKEAHEIKEELSRSSSDSSDDSSTQPQTGMSAMSNEERQKKLAASRAEFTDYKHESKKKQAAKKRKFFGFFGGNKTKKSKKGMSLCVKKTAKKCTKVRGCKVASGKKRTYCRKKKNHTQKSNKK